MSSKVNNVALGATAALAGAVVAGAVLLTPTPPKSQSAPRYGSTLTIYSPGQINVSVTVKAPEPAVTLSGFTDGDVFLSSHVNISVQFKETQTVGYTLTAPNGHTCELQSHTATNFPNQETATQTIDFSTCEGGAYGSYTLKAYAPGFANVKSEKQFYYAPFSIKSTAYDNHGDPIVFIKYGAGIGAADLTATCGASATNILGDYRYVVENNEDFLDEVLLPFANKDVAAGTCTIRATAKKANGDPINSQETTGATVQTTIDYQGHN